MKIIRLADGSLVYPSKLMPPDSIEGYNVDPNNPWRFIPAWVSCDHRELIKITLPCGKQKEVANCKVYMKLISKSDCDGCIYQPKIL